MDEPVFDFRARLEARERAEELYALSGLTNRRSARFSRFYDALDSWRDGFFKSAGVSGDYWQGTAKALAGALSAGSTLLTRKHVEVYLRILAGVSDYDCEGKPMLPVVEWRIFSDFRVSPEPVFAQAAPENVHPRVNTPSVKVDLETPLVSSDSGAGRSVEHFPVLESYPAEPPVFDRDEINALITVRKRAESLYLKSGITRQPSARFDRFYLALGQWRKDTFSRTDAPFWQGTETQLIEGVMRFIRLKKADTIKQTRAAIPLYLRALAEIPLNAFVAEWQVSRDRNLFPHPIYV